MGNTSAGLLLLVFAGIANASFALPMKYMRGWKWENTWLMWSLFALLVLPMGLAFSLIPGYAGILQSSSSIVLGVALCGAAWGVAQVMFGLALARIGIALTFSIVLGLSAAMGSLIPLLRFHFTELMTRSGVTSLIGICLVLVGVAVCAVAGTLRDRGRTAEESESGFTVGLLMAVAAGLCASMMNVGFAYGQKLADDASAHGAGALWVSVAIWAPLLLGGAIPNIGYCLFLFSKEHTAQNFRTDLVRNTGFAFSMALLWFGSSILYGIATIFLGTLGKVVGWPLFMSLIVIVAGVLGIVSGEWKGSDPRALRVQGLATAILIAAVLVLSRATL